MKRTWVVIGLLSALIAFSGCGTGNETKESSASESSNRIEASKEKAEKVKKEKLATEKKKMEEKIKLAEESLKNAENNVTEETVAAAKKAIENLDSEKQDAFKSRLTALSAKLETIRQQDQAKQAEQAMPTEPEQTEDQMVDSAGRPAILKQNDADGNGIADDSPYNKYSSWDEAQNAVNQEIARLNAEQAAKEAAEQARMAELQKQQDAAFAEQAKNQEKLPQVIQGKENGYLNPDGTPTGNTGQ